MATVSEAVPELVAGDFLSREEFLRRWEAMPHIKFAELIQGVVYIPSPLSRDHGRSDFKVAAWLGVYEAATPGLEGLINATWLMGEEDVPQPDTSLRILSEWGGQSRTEGLYVSGAPEFLAEICRSSTAYDLHQKRDLYEEAGVQEYLAILQREREVRWFRLVNGRLEQVPPPADGVYRSVVFPGLWLDAAALLNNDSARVLAVLQQGIASAEHQAFVAKLAGQRTSS